MFVAENVTFGVSTASCKINNVCESDISLWEDVYLWVRLSDSEYSSIRRFAFSSAQIEIQTYHLFRKVAFKTVSENGTVFQNALNSVYLFLDRSGGVESTAVSTLHISIEKNTPKNL